jgi:hypothetical protein
MDAVIRRPIYAVSRTIARGEANGDRGREPVHLAVRSALGFFWLDRRPHSEAFIVSEPAALSVSCDAVVWCDIVDIVSDGIFIVTGKVAVWRCGGQSLCRRPDCGTEERNIACEAAASSFSFYLGTRSLGVPVRLEIYHVELRGPDS